MLKGGNEMFTVPTMVYKAEVECTGGYHGVLHSFREPHACCFRETVQYTL